MSELQPITVYSTRLGPNPPKVCIILEELGIPYKKSIVEFAEVKGEWFTKINPNGRTPAIEDPNTGVNLWESSAIVEYLIETYDKEHKLSTTDPTEKWQLKQYSYFQASGQGPYYGQAMWFHRMAPEDVPIAKKRYHGEIVRVLGVLDKLVEGKQYLLGDKITYVDLCFVVWNQIAFYFPPIKEAIAADGDIPTRFPNFWAWHQRLMSRPAVKKVLEAEAAKA